MKPRLAASVVATGLLRQAESDGGFGMVLQRGEATSGAILVVLLEKGGNPLVLERLMAADGDYAWSESGPKGDGNDADRQKFLEKRRRIDPDLWILELDVPSRERFAAGMNALD